jgi:hypothetical protein
MKIKPTPFLFAAACPILFAAWSIISGEGGNLIGLVVLICLVISFVFFALYYISSRVFKDKFRTRWIVEFLLVLAILFAYYRQNEQIVLYVPNGFQGYIIIMYGVPGQPKLVRRNMWSPRFEVDVPPSGVIYTSTNYGRGILLSDSSTSNGEMRKPGYGIPFFHLIAPCRQGSYATDIIVFRKLPPDWNPQMDSMGRKERLKIACDHIDRY